MINKELWLEQIENKLLDAQAVMPYDDIRRTIYLAKSKEPFYKITRRIVVLYIYINKLRVLGIYEK